MEVDAELKDFILTFYRAVETGDMAVISEMTADEPCTLFAVARPGTPFGVNALVAPRVS